MAKEAPETDPDILAFRKAHAEGRRRSRILRDRTYLDDLRELGR